MHGRDRWQRIEELYHAALAREERERAAYLREACADDEPLRHEVESLLACAPAAAGALNEPALQLAARAMGDATGVSWVGRRVGVYEIQARLGAGGMGEVYRARDTKLGREVAIKVLPPIFTLDPERRARFDREARALAALNHPHIAAIYQLEEADGVPVLVLELVDGETLATRIALGRLPIADALAIARQIAEALEAAHEKGIIHRDLKPANIVVASDGTVKVLDFGLAKVLSGDTVGADPAPAASLGGTREGAILGTPAYMSPEQARGKPVDKRTDIWAFGCVLYEMVTGRAVFAGDTVSDTIAAILQREPAWNEVPGTTPPGVRRLLQRCLEKDPNRRLHDIGDARVEIDDALAPRRRSVRTMSLAAGAVVVAVALIGGSVGRFYRASSPPAASTAEYGQITNFTDAAMGPSLSPDGHMVAFKRGVNRGQVGAIEDFLGVGQIYVKMLPDGEAVQLTNNRATKFAPVFTPDGTRIAYTALIPAGNSLSWDTFTVPVLGGPPTRLLPNASGLTWIDPQHVLFSEISSGYHMGIVTATEARAESRTIYFPALELGMAHYSYLSPDRKTVLIVEMANEHAFDSPCRLLPFDGSSIGRQVGPAGICLSAAWSPDGKWMYFSADVSGNVHLWRQRYPDGTPEQITFGPTQEQGIAVAPDGRSLITSIGNRLSTIWIHDAAGERAITSEGYASAPQLSADGTRVFFLDSENAASFSPAGPAPAGDLRVADLASGRIDTVLPGIQVADYQVSRDGREVVFTTRHSGGGSQVWLAPVDRHSSPRPIATSGDQPSFGANGEVLFRLNDKNVNFLYRIKKDGTGRERVGSQPILVKYGASPDGEWVVAVVPVPAPDDASEAVNAHRSETVAIPVRGGAPREICGTTCPASWSPDGTYFYVTVASQTRAMPVHAGESLPVLAAHGLDETAKPGEGSGIRVVAGGTAYPGADPSIYVFRKPELHANLYRIPLN